jgi:hypothetical protein
MLLDMITVTALPPQMEHTLKDTLHDYWSRLRQLHKPFYSETMTQDRFYTHCVFYILQTVHRDLTKVKNMMDYGN